MKKTTILLLVIVYVLSFLIIGLLGQSVRGYDPVVYPESILVTDPDGLTTVKENVKDKDTGELLYNYYFRVNTYTPGMSVRIRAQVKPETTSYPYVDFVRDASDLSYNLDTHATNAEIEVNYAVITLTKNLEPSEIEVANFFISTTTPGNKITYKNGVIFANI